MGTRGPTPKRDAARAGHRAKSERARRVQRFAVVPVPKPDPAWHPDARAWYDSLDESAQSAGYEPSDWQHARIVAGELSVQLSSLRPSAERLKAIFHEMAMLGTTEVARRRSGLEVDGPAARAKQQGAKPKAESSTAARIAKLAAQ